MRKNREHSPIAIIGMASIFPQAANIQDYWDNIVNKVNSIIDVPATHWNIDDYYDPDPRVPDKVYSKRGGFLPEIDFDPLEFGLPPNILEVTDTSQLLSLVVAKEALTDAGYLNAADALRERTGIVLGVGGGQKLIAPLMSRLQYPVWRKVLSSAGVSDDEIDIIIEKIKKAYVGWEENSFPGLLGNVVTGRIANRFDLGGINTVVDAACASSLSAVNMAVNELAIGNADMMISGGMDTDNSPFMYMCFSKTPAFSASDYCRPFDTKSDGMMVGEGIGMVVLKRLEDAERDGDRIYAMIKAIGSSSDGRYKSIYAPRSEGQERALRRAYERAGVSPDSISLVEAHGTGTVAGDITESNTLVRFLSERAVRKNSIALGSVKSQIGHTKAAAGIAGLIKAALAVYHQVLPPMINIDEPNPKLNLDDSPFFLNTEPRPWISSNGPRRAGVSAFGFGGTNFHAVLEEHASTRENKYRMQATGQLVLLAANTPPELRTELEINLNALAGDEAENAFNNLLKNVTNVSTNAARVGFVARTAAEASERLQAALQLLTSKLDAEHWEHPKGIYYRKSGLDLHGKVVALFSGQGSQYVNMGRELALNFPPVRETLEAMDRTFGPDTSLTSIIYPPVPETDQLPQTEYAQPAIGAFSAGLYKVLRAAGFQADFAAGHSFGELTALWAAGAVSDADYYKLVHARGQAMAAQDTPGFDAGAMLAVTGNIANLEQAIAPFEGVVIANLNSPKQVVLAGPQDSIKAAQEVLSRQGYNVIPLSVSAAFHTPLVGHAQKPFADAIHNTTFNTPTIPVYSNSTAAAYPNEPAAIQEQLSNHILSAVQFQREIENIHAAGGYLFVEFGPRNVLTNLVKDILQDQPHHAIALNANRKGDSDTQLRDAIAQLCVLGLPLAQFDPYRFVPKTSAPAQRKGVKVKISGANYVSEKTRTAFDEALNDGFTLSQAEPQIVEQKVEVPVAAPTTDIVTPAALPAALERGAAVFEAQQREALEVHERYLANQAEYFQLVAQLSAQQQQMIASGTLTPAAVENLTHSMARLHDYQAETLRIHEQYLRQQAESMQAFIGLLRDARVATPPVASQAVAAPRPAFAVPAQPAPEPVAAPAAPGPTAAPTASAPVPAPAPATPAQTASGSANGYRMDETALANAMLNIISEKTGYPADVLDLSMDMESDLGIDSIKRVEILGAMREQFPNLPTFNADELTELRTLQEIVDYMQGMLGDSAPAAAAPTASAPVPAPAPATPAPTASGSANGYRMDKTALANAMLNIISEKTGYPADVLDLSMDMESDLGIDSIKRVEILGAMREQFPNLPTFNADELTELRTLQEIVDYMQGLLADPEVQPSNFFRLTHDIPRSQVTQQFLPRPDFLDYPLLDGAVCLITDDGTPLTAALTQMLTTHDWRVVVLAFPATVLAPSTGLNVPQIVLPELSETALQNALASINGPIQAFIHLNPAHRQLSNNGDLFVNPQKDILKHIFLLAKYLKPTLTANGVRRSFMTVTRLDGALGVAPNGQTGAISGGLFGLTKTLNLEWATTYCRAVDLAQDMPSQAAAQRIFAELHDPNQLVVEVAYTSAGRATLVAESVDLVPAN